MGIIAWNEWILLSVFFFSLSFCWTLAYFFDKRKQEVVLKRPQDNPNIFLQPSSTIRISGSLPWEGSLKLVLTGSFTIILVVGFDCLPSDLTKKIEWSTIYLFFAITGLIDLHVYFCRTDNFPLNLDKFSLCLCYAAQSVLISSIALSENDLRQAFIRYYVYLIMASSGMSALETIHTDDSFKLFRALLASVQATWSYHIGLMNQGNLTASLLRFDWLSLLFVWHIAGNLIIIVICLTISKIITCCKKDHVKTVSLSLEDYEKQLRCEKNVDVSNHERKEKCSSIDYPSATIDLASFGYRNECKSVFQSSKRSRDSTRTKRQSIGRSMPSIDYSTLDCKAKLLSLDDDDHFRIVESKII